MDTNTGLVLEKLGFSIDEFCKLSGLGRTFIYQAIADGKLVARKAGSRTILLPPDARAYLEGLPKIAEAE
jgi:excisionase family DNA binding protein